MGYTNKTDYSSFKLAVENSEIKDAKKAGREVAEKTLQKLGCKPDFVFLFCTAHYRENNGLKKLLDGVWDFLPDNTVLVGGTISGFQNQEGCFARGVTMLAVNYPNMNISVGYGKNSRRNPKKAARKCSKMIKENLENKFENKFENKMLFSFMCPAENIELLGLTRSINTDSKTFGLLAVPIFYIFQKIFQKGLGTEQEFLEELKKYIPDFYFLHSSTVNCINYGTSYQFFNKKVYTESAVVCAIEIDLKPNINYELAAEKIGVDFKVTKTSRDKKIIKKINNKPAFKELLKILDWPSEDLKEDRWLTKFLINPMGFLKNNKIVCRCVVMILGNYIGCFGKVDKEDIFMMHMSQSKIVESTEKALPKKNPIFGFFISCLTRQYFLGIKIFEVNKTLKKYFKEKPFLVIYTAGEGICDIKEEPLFLNGALVSTVFCEDKNV